MAISPPSDIVLDVARAVEPAGVEAARAALVKRAGGVVAAFSADESAPLSRLTAAKMATAEAQKADPGAGNKFKRFEAMVLQTFIQNMLPKDTEGVYGKGLAGDMWKSQMAEQLADVMAERGGIGIARSMLADHYRDGKRSVPVGPVSGGPQKTEIDQENRLSTAMVQELQRKIAQSMTGDEASATVGTDNIFSDSKS